MGADQAAGVDIVRDFLTSVGFPLAKDGIRKLASSIWNTFAKPKKPPPIPPAPSFVSRSQTHNTIRVYVELRDHRPRIEVIRVPDDP